MKVVLSNISITPGPYAAVDGIITLSGGGKCYGALDQRNIKDKWVFKYISEQY